MHVNVSIVVVVVHASCSIGELGSDTCGVVLRHGLLDEFPLLVAPAVACVHVYILVSRGLHIVIVHAQILVPVVAPRISNLPGGEIIIPQSVLGIAAFVHVDVAIGIVVVVVIQASAGVIFVLEEVSVPEPLLVRAARAPIHLDILFSVSIIKVQTVVICPARYWGCQHRWIQTYGWSRTCKVQLSEAGDAKRQPARTIKPNNSLPCRSVHTRVPRKEASSWTLQVAGRNPRAPHSRPEFGIFPNERRKEK
mmetsp:Transcript_25379/g.58879  ORF Transcript_25379/g.58879 Transcript_25379/m.58879 type:complete len:251 (-) Transcript_25379:240-992(-)